MIRTPSKLRTVWFMGAKTRIVPGFIEGAVADLLPVGGTVLDVCTGTGIVARSLADRYRIVANDVLSFCSVVARAHLESEVGWQEALEELDPEEDLGAAWRSNLHALETLLSHAVEAESALLPRVVTELKGKEPSDATATYRAFLEGTPDALEVDSPAGPLYSVYNECCRELLRERQNDPRALPYALITLFFPNVYFGVRQSLVLDSYRAAIDLLPAGPYVERKRWLYLAALVYAASVSTSGTSHFAQPRSVRKDRELLAVAKRRLIDIESEFHRALDGLRGEWGQYRRNAANRVFCLEVDELLAAGGPLEHEDVGLIYFDPPYTADHHSRFYHVLETLVRYDYPEPTRRQGRVVRGRYPTQERRFLSEYCRPKGVERAFRRLVERSRALGAQLLVSYSESGLLLRHWAQEGEENPLARFRTLFRDYYPRVEIRDRRLLHSGQGDSNLQVKELLVLCEG